MFRHHDLVRPALLLTAAQLTASMAGARDAPVAMETPLTSERREIRAIDQGFAIVLASSEARLSIDAPPVPLGLGIRIDRALLDQIFPLIRSKQP